MRRRDFISTLIAAPLAALTANRVKPADIVAKDVSGTVDLWDAVVNAPDGPHRALTLQDIRDDMKRIR